MAKIGKWDGLIMGALLGALIAYPGTATSLHNFLEDLFPSSWDWIGSMTKPLLIIALGAVIGLIIDRTK